MPVVRRIAGRPGTLAPGPDPGDREDRPLTTPTPAPPVPRTAPPARRTPPPRARRTDRITELERVVNAIRQHESELQKPHVLGVRAGYKFKNGAITTTPAIVVLVDRKLDVAANDAIPPVVGGYVTDVAIADPFERLRLTRTSGEAAPVTVPAAPRLLIDELHGLESFEEAIPQFTYRPPPDGDLSSITGAMTIICHVSPDAGWKVLEPFLAATSREMVLGMYDFTAPHIYQAARAVLKKASVRWKQTLGPKESLPAEHDVDSTKADDLTEAQVNRGLNRVGGDRFDTAFAHVGSGRTFASAYHIKVAVRDGAAFWLSSGNWQSSNQPDIDFLETDADTSLIPRFNREWHMVVEHPALAKTFRLFLKHDFTTAQQPAPEAAAAAVLPDLLIPVDEFLLEERAPRQIEVFAPRKFVFSEQDPVTVQPILTPDNYLEHVLELLRRKPTKRLWFQNQSLNPILDPTEEFEEMLALLAGYSHDDALDARFIFRNIGPVRKKLESLQAAGFNMRRVRMQSGCHTKGLIIDSKTVLIGSHNCTNQGVQANRDASLLIRDAGIAKYYERVFEHDWEQLARETIREEATPIPAGLSGDEAALDGAYVRVPWSFLQED
jgi:hypothetical protein